MSCIEGKVILITGASSGFGMVTAKQCVEHGAKVVLGARREDRLSDLCNELGNENAIFKATDVTNKQQVNDLANFGIDTFGKIDSLVNNAGIMPLSFIEQGRTDEWDSMIDVNIKGVLYGIDSVYSHMLERESGQIINIGSGKPISIKKVVLKICKLTGGGNPKFGKIYFRNDEILKLYPDISKAKKLLKWQPKVSFNRGILKTIKFFKKLS